MKKIAPCLWFDRNALEAAKFYVSIFKKSRIKGISYYGKEGREIHGMPEGTVLTVDFVINGQPFTAMNGGPLFKFNEAISLQVPCDTEKELDRYWAKLTKGGDPKARQCGWLKDKYGVSWQVGPSFLATLLKGRSTVRTERVMKAIFPMKKLDFKALKRAYAGK
jgi:predicted 3-demethylubiquinone-9 3-methyltransferase (glyoxalase superfamily)